MKIPDWAKQVIGIVVFVGGMLVWLANYHVPGMIDSQTKGMSNDVSSLKTAVADEKGDVQRIDATVNGLMKELVDAQLASLRGIKNQSAGVAKERLSFIEHLVGEAKQAGILANPAIVAEAGRNALDLTQNLELRLAAWETTQRLLSYQSFLTPKPVTPEPPRTGPLSNMWSTGVLPFTVSSLTVYSWTTNPEEMASFEPLNQKRNENVPNGPGLVSLNGNGGDLQIDEHRAKNVIFNNLRIIYRGGRLDFNRVYFVNCIFDFPSASRQTVLFARALFSSSPSYFVS